MCIQEKTCHFHRETHIFEHQEMQVLPVLESSEIQRFRIFQLNSIIFYQIRR